MDKEMFMSNTTSRTIDVLRFPLAIAVVMCHIEPTWTGIKDIPVDTIDGYILRSIIMGASGVFINAAVPLFFIFSGYLLFLKIEKFDFLTYKNILVKKFRSLFVPYVLWTILAVIFFLMRFTIKSMREGMGFFDAIHIRFEALGNIPSLFWDYCVDKGYWTDLLPTAVFFSVPFVSPLWFLRDLIVLMLLSPIIYFLVKRMGIAYLILCFMLMLITFPYFCIGIGSKPLFYFGIGAFMSIHKLDMAECFRRYNYISILLFIVSFFAYFKYQEAIPEPFDIYPILLLSATLLLFNAGRFLVEKFDLKANRFLVGSTFFIFASHFMNLYIICTPMDLTFHVREFLGIQPFSFLGYLLAPTLTVSFCLIPYWILSKIMPSTLSCFTGNR